MFVILLLNLNKLQTVDSAAAADIIQRTAASLSSKSRRLNFFFFIVTEIINLCVILFESPSSSQI